MTAELYSLEEALADSSALADIASSAQVPLAAAESIAAGLAALPIRQAIRICVAAQQKKNRRKGR